MRLLFLQKLRDSLFAVFSHTGGGVGLGSGFEGIVEIHPVHFVKKAFGHCHGGTADGFVNSRVFFDIMCEAFFVKDPVDQAKPMPLRRPKIRCRV